MVTESALETALNKAWARETSSDPEHWTPANPAWGQCAVTALIVHDYLGYEIVWANAVTPDGKSLSHYFNRANGQDLDFTRSQFPEGTVVPLGVPKPKEFPSTRDYVLSFAATAQRYALLKRRVEEYLPS